MLDRALITSFVLLAVACGQGPTNTGGTGGGGGGGGAVAPRCNTSNCAGCCDASDVCQLGQTNSSCGSGGNACLACGAGLTCSAGACTPGTGGGGGGGGGGSTTGTKRVFVTSSTYVGNLKTAGAGTIGLAGGDRLCNTAAQAANLGGTWVAWLSTSTVTAPSRITSTGPWVLVGTQTIAFNNKANLGTQPLVPLDRDENGQVNPSTIWTGTRTGGSSASNNCNEWAGEGYVATTGYSSQGTGTGGWTEYGSTESCSLRNSLLCFEQ